MRRTPVPARALRALLVALAVLAAAEVGLSFRVPPADPVPLPYRNAQEFNWGDDLPGGVHLTRPSAQVVDLQPPPGRLRVVVVGGSAVAGAGLTPYHSFPWRLQRRLIGRGMDAEVLNLGLPGADSGHHLGCLRKALARLRPQAAVVYSGNNEFHRLRAYRYLNPAWSSEAELVRTTLEASALYRWLAGFQSPPAAPRGREGPAMHDLAVEVTRRDVGLAGRFYRANLEAMAEACREQGVPLVLCTVAANDLSRPDYGREARDPALRRVTAAAREGDPRPAGPAVREALGRWPSEPHLLYDAGNIAWWEGRFDEARAALDGARELDPTPNRSLPSFRGIVLGVARRPGVVLCDLEEGLRGAARGGILGDEFFLDNCHLTARGAEEAAGMLEAALQAAGVVPPGGPAAPPPADPEALERWLPGLGDPDSPVVQGHQEFRKERFREAEALYLAALEDHPERPSLWLDLARARLARREPRGALEALEEFLRRGGRDPVVDRDVPLLQRAEGAGESGSPGRGPDRSQAPDRESRAPS